MTLVTTSSPELGAQDFLLTRLSEVLEDLGHESTFSTILNICADRKYGRARDHFEKMKIVDRHVIKTMEGLITGLASQDGRDEKDEPRKGRLLNLDLGEVTLTLVGVPNSEGTFDPFQTGQALTGLVPKGTLVSQRMTRRMPLYGGPVVDDQFTAFLECLAVKLATKADKKKIKVANIMRDLIKAGVRWWIVQAT